MISAANHSEAADWIYDLLSAGLGGSSGIEYAEYPAINIDTTGAFTGGMKVRFGSSGLVTAIRVFTGSDVIACPGFTVGLWLPDGTALARAIAPPLNPGWNTVPFPESVEVDAGITYVVSVYWPDGTGMLVRTMTPWNTNPVESGNVRILGQGEDGDQGFYSSGDNFPGTYWSGNAPVLTPEFTLGISGIPIHPAPIPTVPVSTPCILIATPEGKPYTLSADVWQFTMKFILVAGNTTGEGLLALIDDVAAVLAKAGITVNTTRTTYKFPDSPAAFPAQLFSLE